MFRVGYHADSVQCWIAGNLIEQRGVEVESSIAILDQNQSQVETEAVTCM